MDSPVIPDTAVTPIAWALAGFTDARQLGYARYDQYLTGNQPLAFATEKFRSAFSKAFREFAYNRCGMVVDAHADRLQVAGFASDDQPVADSDETRNGNRRKTLAQLAQELWDANRMDVREGQVTAEALGMGDSYVLVEVHPETGAIHLWPQRAHEIRVCYLDTEPGVIDLAAKLWRAADKHLRLNLYFRDRIEKYRTEFPVQDGTVSTLKPASFVTYQPETDTAWPVPLTPGDTVPVFAFANNAGVSAYGRSELHDVLPLQDAINKTLMDMLVTMEFAAFPQRVLINVDTDDDETVENIRKFQSGVDRLLTLMGGSKAEGQPSIAEFTAANIQQYISVGEFWDKAISRVSKVPVHYLSMTGDFPSGRALRIAEAPFVAKLSDRQRAFGQVWTDAMTYALRLQGVEVPQGSLRVNWSSAAPMSAEDELDLAEAKRSIGMPLESVLREMGYEPSQLTQVLTELARSPDDLPLPDGDAAPEEGQG